MDLDRAERVLTSIEDELGDLILARVGPPPRFRADPDENVNVADRPDNHEIVQTLAAQLQAGWREARL